MVDEVVAALERHDRARDLAWHHPPSPEERRRDVRQLFGVVLRCVREGSAEPIVAPSQQIAADRFVAGVAITEVQAAFNILQEVLWRQVADTFSSDQRIEALGLLNAALGAGKDAVARAYVSLASRAGSPLAGPPAPSAAGAPGGAGGQPRTDRLADALVRCEAHGRVGVICLDDPRKRNAIGARMAHGVIAALARLRAQDVRAVVLRAAAGLDVWSAGHDIDELPRGKRDPLGYDDPLEELLRAIRTFPAPIVAMVHGTVWGAALDLVLSCDLVTADETASFAITPANLGLPYNTTGLLHFLGRLPINIIKEMFFTAAPLDAGTAKEWLLINHLVESSELEAFTLRLAENMASKSPMAIAVIKEQLRVLTDYQPIAAQVYERIQGLRRQAYDSSDYLEGLTAFAEKRPPVFRGA